MIEVDGFPIDARVPLGLTDDSPTGVGRSMAAAFALGAEGVQLGTRMVSAAESPVHRNWKDAIVAAAPPLVGGFSCAVWLRQGETLQRVAFTAMSDAADDAALAEELDENTFIGFSFDSKDRDPSSHSSNSRPSTSSRMVNHHFFQCWLLCVPAATDR